jgi:hypothetical protein
MIREALALTRPAFDLQAHLARSAEVSAFDLAAWVKPRQTVNVVRSTCKLLRRVL